MKQYPYDGSGFFGLERETLRVDSRGRLAQTPHPFGDDPQITRDFCENQIELITPVCRSVEETLDALETLDRRVRTALAERGEYIWLYSNPPYITGEDEIPIADFTGDHSSKRSYREFLSAKYGKRLMLFSGIHFNFSFSEDTLRTWNTEGEDFRSFRDALYLRLYQQLMRHSWLIVLLTASSPFYDVSLDGDGLRGRVLSEYASMRNSERGYWNMFLPVLDHSSLQAFTESIQQYIRSGDLRSASELYLSVRLKPKGQNNLGNLAFGGVDHIELRMFDLNPAYPLGIDANDLKFAHLLMHYLLTLPDTEFTPAEQEQAVAMHQNAARLHPEPQLFSRAEEILADMMQTYADSAEAQEILSIEMQKLATRTVPCTK